MLKSAPPPAHAELPGRLLGGRYRVQALIARGATAAVYQAEDLVTGAPVAVKVLVNRRETHHQRLLQEWRVISSLDHPCIARIHDAGELDDGTPFLVLDLLEGESLGDLLRRQGAAPAATLPLLRRAALALGAAHKAGVVHRDVKPDNLFLLGPRGTPRDIRVLDFGLSKGASRLTEPGVAVGTAEYMAPEQTLTDPVDGRADIYALGVVLFRCFSGVLPFEDDNKLALMARQLLAPPPPFVAAHGGPGASDRLARVVACALRKRPDLRYPTMDALAADLSRLMQGLDPAGHPGPEGDDIYLPRSEFGRGLVASFYQLLGWSPPAWASEAAAEAEEAAEEET